jgi:hypothetical protein
MDVKCNLLGYRRHHSTCYTLLFTTPQVVTTVSGYNEFWPSDILSRSGPWISSLSVLNADSSLTPLFSVCFLKSKSKSQCDWRSVSKSWYRAPWPDIYFCLTVMFLFPWGALSDERMGLSFVYAAGPCQRSLSRVRVPWYSRQYFTVSDLRLPFSSPPTTRRVTVEVFDPATTRVVLKSTPSNTVFASGIEDTFSHGCIFRCNNLVA